MGKGVLPQMHTEPMIGGEHTDGEKTACGLDQSWHFVATVFFKRSKTLGSKIRSRCYTVSGGTDLAVGHKTTGGTPVPPMVSETRLEDLVRPFIDAFVMPG